MNGSSWDWMYSDKPTSPGKKRCMTPLTVNKPRLCATMKSVVARASPIQQYDAALSSDAAMTGDIFESLSDEVGVTGGVDANRSMKQF